MKRHACAEVCRRTDSGKCITVYSKLAHQDNFAYVHLAQECGDDTTYDLALAHARTDSQAMTPMVSVELPGSAERALRQVVRHAFQLSDSRQATRQPV